MSLFFLLYIKKGDMLSCPCFFSCVPVFFLAKMGTCTALRVTIRRWVKEGKIPYYKPGKEYLFVKEDIDDFINKHKRT